MLPEDFLPVTSEVPTFEGIENQTFNGAFRLRNGTLVFLGIQTIPVMDVASKKKYLDCGGKKWWTSESAKG